MHCGTAIDSAFTLTNNSELPATFTLRSTNSAYSVAGSVFVFAGALDTIPVHFSGGSYGGAYVDSIVVTDTCGDAKTILFKATVDLARCFPFPQSLRFRFARGERNTLRYDSQSLARYRNAPTFRRCESGLHDFTIDRHARAG